MRRPIHAFKNAARSEGTAMHAALISALNSSTALPQKGRNNPPRCDLSHSAATWAAVWETDIKPNEVITTATSRATAAFEISSHLQTATFNSRPCKDGRDARRRSETKLSALLRPKTSDVNYVSTFMQIRIKRRRLHHSH